MDELKVINIALCMGNNLPQRINTNLQIKLSITRPSERKKLAFSAYSINGVIGTTLGIRISRLTTTACRLYF
jgi:hypothetical protein